MNLSVLLSCMHQDDHNIIARSNLSSDVIVINQCNTDKIDDFYYKNQCGNNHYAHFIYTKERGLSRSRNMAIRASSTEICLIADDDEVFTDNYPEIILKAFETYNADVIAFSLNYGNKKFPLAIKKIGYLTALKINSVQIAFRRKSIIDNNLFFDEKMGAGTGNGAGEENKFIYDCLKKKLKIIYVPQIIATVKTGDSSWFNGYTKDFFLNRGWATRRYLGLIPAFLYLIYFSIFKHRLYKKDISFFKAVYYQTKGLFLNKKDI